MSTAQDRRDLVSLGEFAGATLLTDPIDLVPYRRDTSATAPGRPDAVVRPESAEAVAEVLRRANRERIPVYARGGATMYAGGVNPHSGGIVLDLGGLDRILDIDLDRGIVVCEPGVRFGALLAALAPHGQTIGIVPSTAPAATVGGALSAHALGTGSPQFQSFGDQVAGVEVVLADGQRVKTGSAAAPQAGYFQRYCIGPDLTGLFLGADGTLGVVVALALWLHPLPQHRQTNCYGFADAEGVQRCIQEIQRRELVGNIWYAGAYEAATVKTRIAQVFPEKAEGPLPQFAFAVDYRGEADRVREDEERIAQIAARSGGAPFPDFNEAYFRKLRTDEIYWYSFAGFFAISRCAILMSSVPTDRLCAFLEVMNRQRQNYPQYPLGAAVVMCRRGLHGGALAFYDEATQWEGAVAAMQECAQALVEAGCVPYKTGKVWARQVQGFTAYSGLLGRIKRELDPHGILSPGDLGLGG